MDGIWHWPVQPQYLSACNVQVQIYGNSSLFWSNSGGHLRPTAVMIKSFSPSTITHLISWDLVINQCHDFQPSKKIIPIMKRHMPILYSYHKHALLSYKVASFGTLPPKFWEIMLRTMDLQTMFWNLVVKSVIMETNFGMTDLMKLRWT